MKRNRITLMSLALIVASVLVSVTLPSCNQNNPDNPKGSDTSLHQPTDSASWTPLGKRYVRDRSANPPDSHEYFYEVVWFRTSDSAVWYNAITPDLSQMHQSYPCAYSIEYPNAILTFYEVNHDKYYFTDTLTLYSANSSGAFILAN